MKEDYQTKAASAATDDLMMLDAVTVANLTETVREGLLALAVGAGLQVIQVMIQDSVTTLAIPARPGACERGCPTPLPSPVRRAAHAGPHAALHQRHRVDDGDLPGPLNEREALAGRADCGGAPPAWPRRPGSSAGSNGFLYLPALRAALEAHVNEAVAPQCDDDEVAA